MKKVVVLSVVVSSLVFAASSVELPEINVEEKINTKVVKDISSQEIKSADLAEALVKNVPSISLVRRSGIANDIILRGAKKDNINILLDDAKIYGACPNRMDPATSHVLANNIEAVEVIEGPYDVENFGTLSGLVKVKTKEPSKDFGGEVNLNVGSFGYKKVSATVEGGTDKFKVLISASTEESDQYEDGDGDDFAAQQVKHGVPAGNRYADDSLEAYEKKTVMTKAIYNIDDSSEVKLSYTANRSDNILYPNTPMDADYDDSDIYTFGYTKRNIGKYSKELNFESYYSKVDHPMSTRLRTTTMKDMTNHMKSSIKGAKLKNGFEVSDSYITVGLDTSVRNWKGRKFNNDLTVDTVSLPSTDTKNKAIFAKYEKAYGDLNVEVGARYDNTDIETVDSTKNRDYKNLNLNIFTTYKLDNSTKVFAGLGSASRVPDARELYYNGSGNEDLNETVNREIDLGIEKTYEDVKLKSKVFYSDLKDYIYNTNGTGFANVDAKIYGIDFSAMYFASENVTIDFGTSYVRGKKDEALAGQSDKDLAEIPPLKANIGITYEEGKSTVKAEVIASKGWSNYDEDNGEQALSGYATLNVKYDYKINKSFDVSLGIDNLFDRTYATTNTYNDIKYIGNGDTELINEPGRYFYTNLRFTF